jgi:hypothetical protein
MTRRSIVLLHTGGLAATIFTLVRSGARPQILLFAYIFDYLFRLRTIAAILQSLRREDFDGWRGALQLVHHPPPPGQPASPITWADSGRPAGLGGYLYAMAILAFLSLVLSYVGPTHELDVDAADLWRDLGWGAVLGLIYWAQSLASRMIAIDPAASLETNLGYNSREIPLLSFALLTGAVVVIVRQANEMPASGWAVFAPLLAYRFVSDLRLALKVNKP